MPGVISEIGCAVGQGNEARISLYELCLRHAARLPTVQVKREVGDSRFGVADLSIAIPGLKVEIWGTRPRRFPWALSSRQLDFDLFGIGV